MKHVPPVFSHSDDSPREYRQRPAAGKRKRRAPEGTRRLYVYEATGFRGDEPRIPPLPPAWKEKTASPPKRTRLDNEQGSPVFPCFRPRPCFPGSFRPVTVRVITAAAAGQEKTAAGPLENGLVARCWCGGGGSHCGGALTCGARREARPMRSPRLPSCCGAGAWRCCRWRCCRWRCCRWRCGCGCVDIPQKRNSAFSVALYSVIPQKSLVNSQSATSRSERIPS